MTMHTFAVLHRSQGHAESSYVGIGVRRQACKKMQHMYRFKMEKTRCSKTLLTTRASFGSSKTCEWRRLNAARKTRETTNFNFNFNPLMIGRLSKSHVIATNDVTTENTSPRLGHNFISHGKLIGRIFDCWDQTATQSKSTQTLVSLAEKGKPRKYKRESVGATWHYQHMELCGGLIGGELRRLLVSCWAWVPIIHLSITALTLRLHPQCRISMPRGSPIVLQILILFDSQPLWC